MSRLPRVLSKNGMYHIMFRGIDKLPLFRKNSDKAKFSELLQEIKAAVGFELYAYCLMPEYVHLFLKENTSGDIKKIMHRLLTRYAPWYNAKYGRTGPLIENRYKSEPVAAEHVLSLTRYIHQSPLREGIAEKPAAYPWSSFPAYTKKPDGITDTDFVLDMLGSDREEAVKEFRKQHAQPEERAFVLSNSRKKSVDDLRDRILSLTGIPAEEIPALSKPERTDAIRLLREGGMTTGEITRATGLTRGVINYATQRRRKSARRKNDMQAYLL